MTADGAKGGLYTALLAFQASAPHIPLDSVNPHFRSRFASLPEIMKLIRPGLAANGLVWTTAPSQDTDGRPTLRYRLTHAPSGEHLEGEMPLLLTKSDPQGLGSAITYARRYAVLAVLGLVGDEDDDGNAGSQAPAAGQGTGNGATQPKRVTKATAEALVDAAASVGVQDKLQLAASHAHGEDVGDCSTKAAAVAALRKLTEAQAEKLSAWIEKKDAERMGATDAA